MDVSMEESKDVLPFGQSAAASFKLPPVPTDIFKSVSIGPDQRLIR